MTRDVNPSVMSRMPFGNEVRPQASTVHSLSPHDTDRTQDAVRGRQRLASRGASRSGSAAARTPAPCRLGQFVAMFVVTDCLSKADQHDVRCVMSGQLSTLDRPGERAAHACHRYDIRRRQAMAAPGEGSGRRPEV